MADRSDIEAAVALAEAETGVHGGKRGIPLCFSTSNKRARIWTDKEDKFLRDNHGRLSEFDIANHLRRTEAAVTIHIKRSLHLVSMSKAPQILTAEQIAIGLGCDSKTIHLLINRGLMPGRRLPSIRVIRVVDRLAFIKWLLNPDNWLYFKPDRVGELSMYGKRRLSEAYDFAFWEGVACLMKKAYLKWEDQWLTPGQVAIRLRVKASGTRYINKAIHKGTLKAKRWGNWWIQKSDLPRKGKTINFRGEIIKSIILTKSKGV